MKKFQFSIITPSGEFFNDQVESIVAPGMKGSFGVLCDHAPMVTSLQEGPLTVKQHGINNYFSLSSGVLEVNKNNVLLLTDFVKQVESYEEAKAQNLKNAGV